MNASARHTGLGASSSNVITVDDMTVRELALPASLSPSRASEFKTCPRKFYWKAVSGLPDPSGIDAARGTIVHLALERLFEHPRGERTREQALALVAPAFDEVWNSSGYEHLAAQGPALAAQTRDEAAALVERYFILEDPTRFDPHAQELRVAATVSGVDVNGIIDRLDVWEMPDGEKRYFVSDYKAGKPPKPAYEDKAFWAMKVYAVLLEEELGITPYALRLIYLRGTPDRDGQPGTAIRRRLVTSRMLAATRRELGNIWQQIETAAATGDWPTKAGPLCNWCPFQTQGCPEFTPAHLSDLPQPVPFDPSVRRASRHQPRRTPSAT